MAGRQPSQSMTYVPMDVYFDYDPKFIRLTVDFGAKGAFIALKVLFMIYRSNNGYYTQCSDDLVFSIAHDVSCKTQLVKEVVTGMSRCGLVDMDLFQNHNILTSRGIQKRWLMAMKRRKEIDKSKYWLLDDFLDDVDNNTINVDINPINATDCIQESTNQIISNQIKESEEKRKDLIMMLRKRQGRISRQDVLSLFEAYYGKRDLARLIELCDKYGDEAVFRAIDRSGDQAKYQPIRYIEQVLFADEG